MELPRLQCYCHHHCPPDAINGNICEVAAGGKCFAAVEEVFNPETGLLGAEYSYGCFAPGDSTFLQCKGHLVDHTIPASIACCDDGNICNEHLRPTYKPSNYSEPFPPYNTTPTDYFLLQLMLTAIVSLLLLTFLIVLYIVCKYRAREKSLKYLHETDSNKSFLLNCTPSKDPFISIDQSSGSGSGMPLLVQRTIGKQITLKQRIGKGKFGEVYLGEWKGTYVAVKSINTSEEASWWREQQIYKQALMKHPNILVSLAWDIHSKDSMTQMIIVTDFHPKGSLYDYLTHYTLSDHEAMRLVLSAVSGLCHLHLEIEGKPYKPGIAHRDIKSKNILVKANGEACIADFGLAVCSVSGEKGVDVIPITKQGTRRYMAPEVLDDTMKTQWFEAYKQADMYAFALVLWEIGGRCLTDAGNEKLECEDYDIPYKDCVPPDPSFEDMKKVVCDHNLRPDIPTRWNKSKFLRELSKIIRECWHKSPQVRLSALRVKKTLTELRDHETHLQIV
ncbi:unnamed protein product [Orchesella dallaii]|uniref:Serine/threonine-protein kinase receptor n=1 Tax=Orchesella dallaii TaxID=48710 RepID=A0ABP1QKL7_9HEXA